MNRFNHPASLTMLLTLEEPRSSISLGMTLAWMTAWILSVLPSVR